MITMEEAKEAIAKEDHYTYLIGWHRSYMERRPVTNDGKPLPWYVYTFIRFLQGRVNKHMDVFEFGCGYSTLWYSKRVNSVTSVEEKEPWVKIIGEQAPLNVTLHHKTGDAYPDIIKDYHDKFDIICVDGQSRTQCALNLLPALKENGVVIWDNSNDPSDKLGYDHLKENGFKRIDFHGFLPICTCGGCTSVFYRSNNCFNI